MIPDSVRHPPAAASGRRRADRRRGERRSWRRRAADRATQAGWDEQRTQFVTRYLFAALGLAYFNLGESVVREASHLIAINVVIVVYVTITTVSLWHAWRHLDSPLRLRLAMLTDLLGVSAALYVDGNLLSPAYLVYVVIILGNGMRYGLSAFADAAVGSFIGAGLVIGLRAHDYLHDHNPAVLFFVLFLGIIVLYAYALMGNIERARRQLEIASSNDALTGLLNRRGLEQRARLVFAGLQDDQGPVAVLFADLDGFKAVNDLHGHDAGDRLLRQVGRAIATQVRATDVVARLGGDEFVLLMPDTDLEQAAIVAKRLQAAVGSIGGAPGLSLTIGMGGAPADGADLEAVLKAVDAAMYQGKLVGGGIRRADGAAVA